MKIRQLFPLGKAYGDAFCNRTTETERLAGNLTAGKHTLIIAPRRYGKSSLAERAIEQANLPSVKINFHLCTTDQEVADSVLDAVIKLIGYAIGPLEKWMSLIKKSLANLEPLLSFGGDQVSLRLIRQPQANHSAAIMDALLLLEKLLAAKGQRAVLFLDEFQEIDRISEERAIEGAFRTAAQETNHLAIIFSGSIRSLLLSMFEDENRPLYKLCRKIKLERISANDYEIHLQKIAVKTWGKPLTASTFQAIMQHSNRHPYYVNYLCDLLWETTNVLPDESAVEKAWSAVVAEEWSDALRELSALPITQRRLLKHIANSPLKNARSEATSRQLSLASSTIATALHALEEKDYIERDSDSQFQIINPLLLAVLQGAED